MASRFKDLLRIFPVLGETNKTLFSPVRRKSWFLPPGLALKVVAPFPWEVTHCGDALCDSGNLRRGWREAGDGRGGVLDKTEQKYHLANFPNGQREITLFSVAVLFHADIFGYTCSVKGSDS